MTPDNKVHSGNAPIDLEAWEADAKEGLASEIPFDAYTECERILALISELRDCKSEAKSEQHWADEYHAKTVKLEERLKSAEEALKFYADHEHRSVPQCGVKEENGYVARFHFERYKDGD